MGEFKDRMMMDMELKNLSPRTQVTYLGRMRDFVQYFGKSPEALGDEDIRAYFYYLKRDKKASQAVLSQSYSALKLFYQTTLDRPWNEKRIPRSKQGRKLPVVLSPEEVKEIFTAAHNLKFRTIFMTTYSGGLRVSEVAVLKPVDIDSKRMLIRVEQGKGMKDRYTLLGKRTLEVLRTYWTQYRPQKWLFSGRNPDEPIHISSIQKAFKTTLGRTRIQKPATMHTLRHSFATHLLQKGTDLYFIQRFLGHRHARTTCIYLHVTCKDMSQIVSPIDLL